MENKSIFENVVEALKKISEGYDGSLGGHISENDMREIAREALNEVEKYNSSKMIDLWYISCSTGCTCCSDKNFEQGFYKTQEEANNQVSEWLKGNNNPLASQYAKYGRYTVYKSTAELLPDGRMIVDEEKVHDQNYCGRLY